MKKEKSPKEILEYLRAKHELESLKQSGNFANEQLSRSFPLWGLFALVKRLLGLVLSRINKSRWTKAGG